MCKFVFSITFSILVSFSCQKEIAPQQSSPPLSFTGTKGDYNVKWAEQLPDGGYILTGTLKNNLKELYSPPRAFLAKLNKDGIIESETDSLWERFLIGSSVNRTRTGNYVVCGIKQLSSGRNELLLLCLDKNFSPLWKYEYKILYDPMITSCTVLAHSSGDIFFGYYESSVYYSFLKRFSPDGKLLKTISSSQSFRSIFEDNQGNICCMGGENYGINTAIQFEKYSATGNFIFKKRIILTEDEYTGWHIWWGNIDFRGLFQDHTKARLTSPNIISFCADINQSNTTRKGSCIGQIDLDGKMLWKKYLVNEEIFFTDITGDKHGGLTATGWQNKNKAAVVITMCFDAKGNKLWEKEYLSSPTLRSFIFQTNSGYDVLGHYLREATINKGVFHFKTDEKGELR